jgi:LEA14-like dessication related protein
MSTRVSSLVAVVSLAVLLSSAAGCALIEKPSARITGANLQDIGLTEATLLFDVDVDNPYAVALPMSNVDYALASQGSQFLTGNTDVQGSVPAGASKSFAVPVRIDFRKLLSTVEGAKPGRRIPYTADLGLSVDAPLVGRLRVPVSKDGELPIPSSSELLGAIGDIILKP